MTTGCQIIIGDGLRGTDELEVPVPNGEYCKTAKIGRAIMDADIFISLTHFKGHEATGFGGAIKNIGMGCGSRAGKMEQHSSGKPAVQEELCRGCHRCAKECGSDAIRYNENNKAVIDYEKCKGCGRCIGACNFDAIYSIDSSANEELDRKMAEYAAAVCADRPCFHISLVQDISPNCDCHGENDAPILPDIGMFASFDPVALDQACADACLNAQPLPNSQLGQNLAKPGWNCHHDNFKDSNPNVEWKATLEQAEKIGMGTRQYTLKRSEHKTSPTTSGLFYVSCIQGQTERSILAGSRDQYVNDIGQGLPVFLGTAGQLFGIQTGILDAAGHAVLVGQQGLGIGLDERPGIGKALLVIGAQAVEPLGIGIFDVADRLDAHVAAIGPFQQGSRRNDGFQRAAGHAGAPAEAGGKGIVRSERENREFSSASSGPTLPVSAVTVEEGMLSLAEAEELEAAVLPEEVLQPASTPHSRAAQTSRERIRLRIIGKPPFIVFRPICRRNCSGTFLVYCSAGLLSIGVRRTIFHPGCANYTNFCRFFSVGRD